jgi:hypothetical protein
LSARSRSFGVSASRIKRGLWLHLVVENFMTAVVALDRRLRAISTRQRTSKGASARRYRVLDVVSALRAFSGPAMSGVPRSTNGFTGSIEPEAPSAGLAGAGVESAGLLTSFLPASGVAIEPGLRRSFAVGAER